MRKPSGDLPADLHRLAWTRPLSVHRRPPLQCRSGDALGMQTIQCLDPVAAAGEVVQRVLGHPAAARPGRRVTDDRSARTIAGEGGALEIAGITDRGPSAPRTRTCGTRRSGRAAGPRSSPSPTGWVGHKGGLESAQAAVSGAMAVLSTTDPSTDAASTLRRAVAAANDAVAVARRPSAQPGDDAGPGDHQRPPCHRCQCGRQPRLPDQRIAGDQITDDHSWRLVGAAWHPRPPRRARHHQKRNLNRTAR